MVRRRFDVGDIVIGTNVGGIEEVNGTIYRVLDREGDPFFNSERWNENTYINVQRLSDDEKLRGCYHWRFELYNYTGEPDYTFCKSMCKQGSSCPFYEPVGGK